MALKMSDYINCAVYNCAAHTPADNTAFLIVAFIQLFSLFPPTRHTTGLTFNHKAFLRPHSCQFHLTDVTAQQHAYLSKCYHGYGGLSADRFIVARLHIYRELIFKVWDIALLSVPLFHVSVLAEN